MEKTVLITGASGEIGGALARVFARAGYTVLLHYHRNAAAAQALQKLLSENGCRAHLLQADLSQRAAPKLLIEQALGAAGRIDVLVNNAAVSLTLPFSEVSDEAGERLLQTDLAAAMQCARYAVQDMLRRHSGVILNISSVWGLCGASCEVYYSAAKAGMIGFTKSLAAELAPSGIRVNAIAPGVIDSPMNDHLNAAEKAALLERIPAGRFGTGYDVARAALFLASGDAEYITGQTLNISGGFVI